MSAPPAEVPGQGPAQPELAPSALERIVLFSDAVIAIAITLLAFDLRLPDLGSPTDQQLTQALLGVLPHYWAFAISFAVIGLYWITHHRMFRFIVGWDGGLVVLNLLFLFFVVQQPFLAALLGGYGNLSIATAVYAAGLSLMGLSSLAIWLYAMRHHLVDPTVSPVMARYVGLRAGATAAVFLVSIPLAFINPLLAQASWAAVSVAVARIRHKLTP